MSADFGDAFGPGLRLLQEVLRGIVVGVYLKRLVQGGDRLVVLRELEVREGKFVVLVVVVFGRGAHGVFERAHGLLVLVETLVGEGHEVVCVRVLRVLTSTRRPCARSKTPCAPRPKTT